MELSIDEIIRRLLLLGLPLVPLGCVDSSRAVGGTAEAMSDRASDAGAEAGAVGGTAGAGGAGTGGESGAAGSISMVKCVFPYDDMITVVRKNAKDQVAWDLCASWGDCRDLCIEENLVVNGAGSVINNIMTCERVGPAMGPDGGAYSAAGSDARAADGATSDADAGGSTTLDDATVTIHMAGTSGPGCTGRRPAGMARVRLPTCGDAAGRWLAHAAVLEAASVPAFQRLARELEGHGAPARLVSAARAAVTEEARHYVLMARAARVRGVEARPVRVRSVPIRPLVAVARENAREGCVRETFGAMSAVSQALRAPDAELRASMAIIARDESRHARLAWEIDAWARTVLGRGDMRRVDEARREEGARLEREVRGTTMPSIVARTLGLPSAPEARRRASDARRALWSA